MGNEDAVTHEKLIQLEQVAHSGERLVVLTHDNPDPDALASAEGLRYLFQNKWGVRVRAAYGGTIGRAENKTMLRLLKLRLEPVEKLNLRAFKDFALVDTQPGTGNNSLPQWAAPTVVIDHHPRRRGFNAPCVDVRETYGATSTIVTEYLQEAALEIPSPLATALFYGIASDTRNLGRQATEADVKAYMTLFSSANMRTLAKIEFPPLPQSYYTYVDHALENAFIHKNVIGSRIGSVENPDIIPEFADLLLRHEKATWSLCLGRFENKLIISVRTSNPRAEAGRIIRRLVGRKGRAGGHGMMAGGWMDCFSADEKELWSFEEKIIRRFLRLLGKSESAQLDSLVVPVVERKES
ncbi:MAG: DHH family phosphoesterase [Gemmatimonadota bacterium]|nr:MAG: DHH family phosphoesterase [Gemmatimonadota bacterium]